MATGKKNNIHPITGLTNAFAFFKGNFLFALLSFFVFLGFILPPRSRKRRYGNHRRRKPASRSYRRKKSGNPGKKTKSGKPIPRSAGSPYKYLTKEGNVKKTKKQKKSSSGKRTMPARFKDAKRGTPLMAEKMNWLRSVR